MKNSRRLRTAIWIVLGGLLLIATAADYPAWWSERGVIDESRQPQDHHPVNQGQVKWIATQAAEEFNAKLPSPTNSPIDQMTAALPSENNHRPANLGMLKNVAQPFYDRLIRAGYADAYPWTGGEPNDYALANSLSAATFGGSVTAMVLGGLAVLLHGALRLVLATTTPLPLGLPALLERLRDPARVTERNCKVIARITDGRAPPDPAAS